MNGPERAAAAHAVGGAVARVTRAVAGTHEAVTDVVRVGLSPLGEPGRLPVEATTMVARLNYSVVQGGARGVAALAATVLDSTAAPDAPSASDQPAAVTLLAALGAAFGDQLVADPRVRPLTVPMSIRAGGARLDLGPGSVGGVSSRPLARSDQRPTVVLFVHGLGHHESSWGRSYPDVAREADATPLTVRYTTGQSIADSGAELAELLDRLVGAWSVPVKRIVLVGHSMGGLVIRACLAAGRASHDLVSDVITLGTPHAGSPVERFAARGLAAASTFAVAAPILALGDERSAGIKELGFPAVAAPSTGPDWHLVAATLRRPAPVGVLGRARSGVLGALGDGLVTVGSALAVDERLTARRVVIEGASHLALLDHPQAADLLRDILAESETPLAAAPGRLSADRTAYRPTGPA